MDGRLSLGCLLDEGSGFFPLTLLVKGNPESVYQQLFELLLNIFVIYILDKDTFLFLPHQKNQLIDNTKYCNLIGQER